MKRQRVEAAVTGIEASTGPMTLESSLKVRVVSTAIRRGEYVDEKVPGSVREMVMLGPNKA